MAGGIGICAGQPAEQASGPSFPVTTGLFASFQVLVIEWDTGTNDKHTLDYITHYSRIGGYGGFSNIPEVVGPTADIADLSALASQCRQAGTGLLADLNCDGVVDVLDRSILMTLWRS